MRVHSLAKVTTISRQALLIRSLLILLVYFALNAESSLTRYLQTGAGAQAAPRASFNVPTMTKIVVNTGADLESSNINHTCSYESGAIFTIPDDGMCTFRRALREAAARPDADRPIVIEFDLPSDDSNRNTSLNVFSIFIEEALPELTGGGQVLIDGTTQPLIRTVGPGIIIETKDHSLQIDSLNNIIRGVAFKGGGAIFLKKDNNVVEEVWMGLSDDGQEISFRTPLSPNRMAGGGIVITSNGNTVQNSVISGTFAKAIDIGSGASNNIIRNNNIGTRGDGSVPAISQNVQCTANLSRLSDNWYGGWGIALSGSNNEIVQNRIVGLHNVRSTNDTAPIAIEIFGSNHTIRENVIGRDTNGTDLGVCGQGIKVSGSDTNIQDNTIVRSRTGFDSTSGQPQDAAILASDSSPNFGQITVRGNLVIDGPGEIYKFGPSIPQVLKLFEPATITNVAGNEVQGTSGAGSPCPNCLIDLYVDDLDPIEESLQYLGHSVADANGDFTFSMPQALGQGFALRTSSTSQDDNTIGSYGAGTTTKLSILYGADGRPVTPIAPTATPTPPDEPEVVNTPTPTNTPTPSPTPSPTPMASTIITVNTTLDPDSDSVNQTCNYTFGAATYFPASDGLCSFRRAWVEAAGRPPEDRPIEIRFSIPITDANHALEVAGTWVIQIENDLPPLKTQSILDKTGHVYIDGSSQPNGRSDGPVIIVNTNDHSFEIESTNNIFRNMSIKGGGVLFLKEDGNLVENIWMGLSDNGQEITFRTPGDLFRMAGGGIDVSSSHNVIRGNVISGAFAKAVNIGSGNQNNLIVDNYFGTRADGTVPSLDPNVQCQRSRNSLFAGNWYGGWGVSLAGTNNRLINNVIAGLHILQSTNDTPPIAIEVFGAGHIIEGNTIGRDSAGQDVGVCGQAIKISDTGHQILRNTVVRSRQGFENNLKNALLASDSAIGAFGENTVRENIIIDSPGKIYQFGPGIPKTLAQFEPAKITKIDGTLVTGTSGDESPCPGCLIDFYLDDIDDVQEAFIFLGSTLADSNGNFSFVMPNPLTPDVGVRTASTTESSNVIPGFGPGTTTKFSTLYVPLETLDIEGPVSGDPGVTYDYTITVGPSHAAKPISMTIESEGLSPLFVEINEGDQNVVTLNVTWATGGEKIITVVATNSLSQVSSQLNVSLTGSQATPVTPTPTATPTPQPTATPVGTPGGSGEDDSSSLYLPLTME